MADPSNTAVPNKGPALFSQGEHAGKPGLPLGQRLFTLIGSRNRAHLHLLSSTISRNHACIVLSKEGPYIRDLASRTGILINGRRVREADLQDGDLVGVGSFSFKFQDPGTIHLSSTPRAPLAMLEMDRRTFTPLDGRTILIGRRHSCDIPLDFEDVSSTHAIIFESDGRRYVRDLGSRSGTLVNGTAVHQQVLAFGDEVRIGSTTFRYVAADAAVDETADATPALEIEPEPGELDFPEEEHAPIGLDFDDAHTAPAAMVDDGPISVPDLDALEFDPDAPAPLDLGDAPQHETEAVSEVASVETNLTADSTAVESELDLGLDFWTPQASPEGSGEPEEPHEAPIEAANVARDPAEILGEDDRPEDHPADAMEFVDEPSIAPIAEAEPESPAIEPAAADAPFTAIPQEISHEPEAPADEPLVVEPETETPESAVVTPAQVEPAAVETAEPVPVALRVEDVDLSEVKFDAEPAAPETAGEMAEPPPAPTPLLDLAPLETAAVEEGVEVHVPPQAEAVVDPPAPPAKPGKKPRAPRRKSAKKAAEIVETDDAAVNGADSSAATSSDAPSAPAVQSPAAPPELVAPEPLLMDVAKSDFEPWPHAEEPASATESDATPAADDAAAIAVEHDQPTVDSSSSKTTEPMPEGVELVVPSEPGSSADDSVETIDTTEPTPESALDMGSSLAPLQSAPAASKMVDVDAALTDTAFGRAVQEFTGSGLGPLVEEPGHESSFTAPVPDHGGDKAARVAPAEPRVSETNAEWSVDESELSFDESPAAVDEGQTLTGDLSLEQPIETDWAAPAPELAFDSAPASGELPPDFDIDDPVLDAPLELDEFASDDAAHSPPPEVLNFEEEEAQPQGEAPMSDASPIADPTSEVSVEPPPATGETASPQRPVLDPYFGMRRDMGSFIGGMPLELAPGVVEIPLVPPGKIVARLPADAPPTPPAAVEEEGDEEALPAEEWLDEEPESAAAQSPAPAASDDDLFEGEEPLELFDETADQLDALPDDLHPIDDVSGSLADAGAHAPSAPQTPSPTKTPPLRSLTGAAAPAPAQPSVKVPPFAGSRSPRNGANAFAGLATPNLRGTDVFSQTAFPPPDEQLFQPQPVLDIAPQTIRARETPAAQPPPRGPWRPPAGQAAPPAPPSAPEPPPRKPWWKNIRLLLPLLALLIAAAVVVVIRFFPPPAMVQGVLRLKGLDNKDLNWTSRKAQIVGVRDLLTKPAIREIVSQNLRTQGVSPGFVADPAALAALADPQNSPFDQKQQALILSWPTSDPRGDVARMRTLLSVVYTDNLTSAEGAPGAQARAKASAAHLQSLQSQLSDLQASSRKMSDAVTAATGASAQDLLLGPDAAAQSLQTKELTLTKILTDTNAAVDREQAALDQMQAANLAPGATPDQRLLTIRQNLGALKARLAVAKVARAGDPDGGKALVSALQSVEDDLGLIITSTRDASISAYATRARQAAAEIRSLIGRDKQNARRISLLQTQIAAHRQAHLEQVWANDDTLKQMLDQRDGLAQRVAAAPVDASADAAKARGVLDDLDQKIDARRLALATGGQDADELRQSLLASLDRVEQDRADNARRIAADMALLDVPPVNRVQPADQSAIAALGEQIAGAKAAAEAYAAGKPAGSTTADQTPDIQSQIADQQARLEAYQQRQAAGPAIAAAQRTLDDGEAAEAKAQQAYVANLTLMSSLRRLGDAQAQVRDLTGQIAATQAEVERARADAADIPVLLAPDDNSVRVVSESDQRVWYLAGAIGLLLALFAAPLWLAIKEPAPLAPMAMIVAEDHDVPGHGARGQFSSPQLLGDDERTAVA